MRALIPSPLIMVDNNVVNRVLNEWGADLVGARLGVQINYLEVVELLFVEVGQVPEEPNVLEADVVPLVIVWVVRRLVIVHVLSFAPGACDFD